MSTLCSPFRCRKECLSYVRELKKDPCYDGEVGDFLRAQSLDDSDDISQRVHWYAKLDSCDKELFGVGHVVDDDNTNGHTGGSSGLTLSLTSALLAVVSMFVNL